MNDNSFNSYTDPNNVDNRINVDFSKNLSAKDVAGMYADVWGTTYKREDKMLEWRIVSGRLYDTWNIWCENRNIATVVKNPVEYIIYSQIDEDNFSIIGRKTYEEVVEVLEKEYLTWKNMKIVKSLDTSCWECGREGDLHWFWCVKICRKCTHPNLYTHWAWCEEFTTDADECDDSCKSGCLKCQAPREIWHHKYTILKQFRPYILVDDNPEKMLECEWACSMNPGAGCNYPACLPVDKPKIQDTQSEKDVIWCTRCKKWEHMYKNYFGDRTCSKCQKLLDKMELYYES